MSAEPEVTRYGMGWNAKRDEDIVAWEFGEFVKYDDYDALRAERDALAARVEEAERSAKNARSVVTAMRQFLPVPGEMPGECRISVSQWNRLMGQIDALAPDDAGVRDEER